MSGYYTKTIYDQCAYDQALNQNVLQSNYYLFLDKYENDQMTIATGTCVNTPNIGCIPSDANSNANIETKTTSIGLRTDIESDLKSYNRPTTRCANLKYKKCSNNCSSAGCTNTCPNYIVVTPLLSDRMIVPTNMKQQVKTGFE